MSVLKTQLDSLYQEANEEGLKAVKEKVKICCDQLDVAFHKLRVEKQKLWDDNGALTKQKEEIKAQLESKEQEIEGIQHCQLHLYLLGSATYYNNTTFYHSRTATS